MHIAFMRLLSIVAAISVSPALGTLKQCKIFCEGPILHAVQTSGIFKDSKDFVDMPLKRKPDEVIRIFEAIENKTDPELLQKFVAENFREPGTELEACSPQDFVNHPPSFNQIQDPLYRQWAYQLHKKWKTLCRQVKQEVKEESWRYSLIPLPHPFIAPGGRFRELYYWDTYWIVKGLLASEMYITAKNMIRNLGEMVRRFGFVPNGGRIYYLHRTQPPLFPACVDAYFEVTGDKLFLYEMVPLLERELKYWRNERTVHHQPEGDNMFHQLFRYNVDAKGPRPESYKEDLESVHHLETQAEKEAMWSDIAAGAESGWDFSSRWFPEGGSIKTIRTSRIVPVDLNAFACWNEQILAKFHEILGNTSAEGHHFNNYWRLKDAIYKTFWDESLGAWTDLDLDTGRPTGKFFVSNPTPLFVGCHHSDRAIGRKTVKYLERSGAFEFFGGLPTSMAQSGEQWDAPNGWAPTNHIVIEALRKQAELTGDYALAERAFSLANRWIQTNYFVYERSGGKMFEKVRPCRCIMLAIPFQYDVEKEKSAAGGGGEYEVQEGFGWTNGVILDLLLTYGDRLRAPTSHSFFLPKLIRSQAKSHVPVF